MSTWRVHGNGSVQPTGLCSVEQFCMNVVKPIMSSCFSTEQMCIHFRISVISVGTSKGNQCREGLLSNSIGRQCSRAQAGFYITVGLHCLLFTFGSSVGDMRLPPVSHWHTINQLCRTLSMHFSFSVHEKGHRRLLC